MAVNIGQLIGRRYRVDAFLGKGAMAEVYKVWDLERNVYLAMKILHADLAEDRVFLRRFKREADTLSTLQHPNIVRFYGMARDIDIVYMLMDYVDGVTLRKEIFQGEEPFSLERILEVMRSVCAALYYAHKLGFIHCDIKPANIMLQRNGNVFVTDFGISRVTEASTATMIGAGTPAYMSPEQIKGSDPTAQMDIYALGVVLFEMLTGGERPFTGDSAKTTGTNSEKIRWEQLKLPAPPPSKYNLSITPSMDAIVLKCLDKDPENRYLSAMDLYRDLFTTDSAEDLQKAFIQEKRPELIPISDSTKPVSVSHLGGKKNFLSNKKLIAVIIVFLFALMVVVGSNFAVSSFQNSIHISETAQALNVNATVTQQAAFLYATATKQERDARATAIKQNQPTRAIATATPNIGATAVAKSTQVAGEVLAELDELLSDSEIDYRNGYLLWQQTETITINMSGPSGDDTIAAINKNQVASNFILKSDVTWDATGWMYCGAVLRSEPDLDEGKQYQFYFLRLSGLPVWYLDVFEDSSIISPISKERTAREINMANGAVNQFVLVAENEMFVVYFNGVRQGRFFDSSKQRMEGYLGFLGWQESGIGNCKYENSWIWALSE